MTLETLLAFAGRHPYLSLALAGLTIAILYTEVARLFRGYKALRPAELTALINRDNALVVDLSSSSEFEKGHIPGSRNIAPSQFDPEHKQLAAAKALPVVRHTSPGPSLPIGTLTTSARSWPMLFQP